MNGVFSKQKRLFTFLFEISAPEHCLETTESFIVKMYVLEFATLIIKITQKIQFKDYALINLTTFMTLSNFFYYTAQTTNKHKYSDHRHISAIAFIWATLHIIRIGMTIFLPLFNGLL